VNRGHHDRQNQYCTQSFRRHLQRALDNGVTREELIELITHLAFYSGWPTAASAMTIARQVFATEATNSP
jgi:4-carboxymuconolactone decarboxylase